MNTFWETKLQSFWVSISAISLLLPILLNYLAAENINFANAMAGLLVLMFVIALPFSLVSMPLMALFKYGLELEPNSMFAAYFYIILLNIFGYLQWFWLLPKFFNRGKQFKLPTILNNN